MSKPVAVSVCGILGAAAFYFTLRPVTPSEPESHPGITEFVGFDPSTIELGKQSWAMTVPIYLTFVNRSTRDVSISAITTTCGCTVVDDADFYEGQVLIPGEEISLMASLDTGNRAADFLRQIKVTDGTGEIHTAKITVSVKGSWSLSTNDVSFGDVVIDDEAIVSRLVTFSSDEDELSGPPVADSDWIQCRTARRGAERSEILISVVKSRLLPGSNRAVVTVTTNNALMVSQRIQVSATGVQALISLPQHIFLVGRVAQKLTVKDHEGLPVRVVSVGADDERIKSLLVDQNTIEVSNESGSPLSKTVFVVIEDEQGRRCRVPVSTF